MSGTRQFVSEPIESEAETLTPRGAGEPLLPMRFCWRGRRFEIAAILRAWKTTDAGHRGPGNAYLRRHWFDVRTTGGDELRIYGERGGRPGWYLHSCLARDPGSGSSP